MSVLAVVAVVQVILAGAPVVVLEPRVEQYKLAAHAAEKKLSDAAEVDLADPALGEKLGQASLVVAVGRKSLAAARAAVGPTTPVVFCMVLGVTPADLSPSVTGVPLESDPKQIFARLRAVVPAIKRVGVVYDGRSSGLLIERAKATAAGEGVALVTRPVGSAGEVKDAIDGLLGKIDALWLPPDPKLFSRELSAYLLGVASERKLVLLGFLQSFTEAGALASVSPNYEQIGARAGSLAAEIRARPASQRLPVPELSYAPGDLSINLHTAQALGFDVPQAAVDTAQHIVR